MIELEPGPLVDAPGVRSSGLAGAVLPTQFGPTSADAQLVGVSCVLVGWSMRESTGTAGAVVELYSGGNATSELLATICLTSGFDLTASQTPQAQTVNGGNAIQTATITPAAGVMAFVTRIVISGLGATAGAEVQATLTGVLGGTITYPVSVPAGVTVPITPVTDTFGTRGQQASAAGTAISLSVPAFGAGNTFEQASLTGYFQVAAGAGSTDGPPGGGCQARGGIFLHVVSGSVKGTVYFIPG